MKITLLFLVMSFFSFSFADDQAVEKAAAVESPKPAEKTVVEEVAFTGDALAIQKRLDTLFTASKNVNQKGGERAKARAAIEGAMDWEKVAELCLGKGRWKTESAANKGQFKNLLKDVIVLTAYSRMDKFWDGANYKFTKIVPKGNEADVIATFSVKNDSFSLEYFMNKKGGEWTIWDISYEGERYSVNISEQVDAFLKEKGFAHLLDKLKKRKGDLESESKKKG